MIRPRRGPLTVADLTAREREHLELCVHEAGHAVAAVALGAQLRNAVVTYSRVTGTEGLTTLTPDGLPPGRKPEIAYAGPWSQARWRAGRQPTQRQMLAVLGGSGYKDERALIASGGTHLGHGIKPLVERCWPAVIRVAKQLHKSGEVAQADVLAALGVDDGGGPGSSQLASLRSGTRSVPPLASNRQPVPA
ncbi:hypothetical protein [Mycobacterium persicum]|uniref:Peptidase M41 domain-containing protein n=1 Tax=Mycobacterium persicum TaxID=1487726 RepID=A0AB38UY79_9MYCO|nr:hypothetical protein [Mycobacterium persicum]ORB89291.1 hypothetical protein B1T49_08635 [Mycobacterium persicum]VAZ85576.1 hypothetical protein LAUMK42_04414 [Mycobacterium persicum]